MDGPIVVELRPATQPLNCAAGNCVSGSPIGAEGEIDFPIAVDIVRRNANIIGLRLVLNDSSPVPGRILEPHNSLLIDDDDIELVIAIYIDK
jgi:hypothetical protein